MKTLTVTDDEFMRVVQSLDIAAIFWAQREPGIGVYVTEA